MVEHLPLTEARNSLGAVVKRVHLDKKYVILEKDGIPLAGLMDIDEFEDYLDLHDPKVKARRGHAASPRMTPRFSVRTVPHFDRLGRFRFLYDIAGRDVGPVHCALRREDTYRER